METKGKIEFCHNDSVEREYVIVKKTGKQDTGNVENVLYIIRNEWKLGKPNLLISVTGGAKNFRMGERLKEVFRRGLMKVAMSTGAWIITGGTNKGVMKHVGEAIRDYRFNSTPKAPVVAIGIATLGIVSGASTLKRPKKQKGRVQYTIKADTDEIYLDPNHTHFVLVDDGTKNEFGGEISFRAHLEKKLVHMADSKESEAIPVVLLVLQGGKNTLLTVKNAVDNDTPVVIIKGSGQVADVIAFAYQNATLKDPGKDGKSQYMFDAKVSEQIVTKLGAVKGIGEELARENAVTIEEIIKEKTHLVTVYHLCTSPNDTKDIEVAILQALLKANENKAAQLKLAVALNRIDIAEDHIYKDEDDCYIKENEEYGIAEIAILEDKVKFVEMFLDKGMDANKFLTLKRLKNLYNKKNGHISFRQVGKTIQYLIGDFYLPIYLRDDMFRDEKSGLRVRPRLRKVDNSLPQVGDFSPDKNKSLTGKPFKHLFLWAILMNRQEMAKLFWSYCNDQIAAALVGSGILKKMAKKVKYHEVKTKLQANALEFSSLAEDVINECYRDEERRTHNLLETRMSDWNDDTCLHIAVCTDNKKFISQQACQTLLSKTWNGKLAPNYAKWKILLAVVLLPALFFLKYNADTPIDEMKNPRKTKRNSKIEFSTSGQPWDSGCNSGSTNDDNTDRQLSACEKCIAFFTAPCIIFVYNAISYIAFLCLYSYMMIIDLGPQWSKSDTVLLVWVVTLAFEEVRQLKNSTSGSKTSKLRTYITDSWNKLDVLTIVLYITGMSLRPFRLEWARIILGINLMTFFFRTLHIFSVVKNMGPKLVMIRKMFGDLLYFIFIMMVFVVAYAITKYSILYPNSSLNWNLVLDVFKTAYWNLYGELFLDEFSPKVIFGRAKRRKRRNKTRKKYRKEPKVKEPDCTFDPVLYTNNTLPRCPTGNGYIGHVMLAIYVLISNILLLNLLIAMFSYTFQNVQNKTDLVWCFQRYRIIHEYKLRCIFPPPLMIICHLYKSLGWIKRKICTRCKCCNRKDNTYNPSSADESYTECLRYWEKVHAGNYLQRKKMEENESCNRRIVQMQERLDTFSKQISGLLEDIYKKINTPLHGVPTDYDVEDMKLPSVLSPGISLASFSSKQKTDKTDCLQNTDKQSDTDRSRGSQIDKHGEKGSMHGTVNNTDRKSTNIPRTKHVARASPYPGTEIARELVPDDKIPWDVPFDDYQPPEYEADFVKKEKFEIELLSKSPEDRLNAVKFNARSFLNRKSALGNYSVRDGLPLNPDGRTGIKGRGALFKWGPNFAADSILTRWKHDQNDKRIFEEGYPVFEFIALKRHENELWSLPGVILKPGEESVKRLREYFVGAVLGKVKGQSVLKKIETIFQNMKKVHSGFADDDRNTDNAWVETIVYHFHDHDNLHLNDMQLQPGHEVEDVKWISASSKICLCGSHSEFVKKVADEMEAFY